MICLMITNHPQSGSSKGISTLLPATSQQGKLMKTQFQPPVLAAVEEQYLPTVPVPVNSMEVFYNLAALKQPSQTGNC